MKTMTPVRQTADRKLKINDTVYVFRVPKETSLSPMDIIKDGRVMAIKRGIEVIKNVFGEPMGMDGRSWNGTKLMEVELSTDIYDEIEMAILRTKSIIKTEQESGKIMNLGLYRLSVSKHRGVIIARSNDQPGSPYYYIPFTKHCDNCGEPIPGRMPLEVNRNGKVSKEFPFIPDDETVVNKNGGNKFLHANCTAVSVKPEEVTLKEVITKCHEAGAQVSFGLESVGKTPKQLLIELLEDTEVDAEFARGAAWMYLIKE